MTPLYWLLVGVGVVAIGFTKVYFLRQWKAGRNRGQNVSE